MLGRPRLAASPENAGVKRPSSSPLPKSAARVPSRGRAAGFTLIEVMVALIVLVLGVLGAAAMTLSAMRDTKQSALRSTASALAYELGDLMRASGSDPTTEAIFTGNGEAQIADCWVSGCTPADMARNEFYEWKRKLANPTEGLPNASVVVCRDSTAANFSSPTACDNNAASGLVIKLQWDEKNNLARDATNNFGTQSPVTRRFLVVPVSTNY